MDHQANPYASPQSDAVSSSEAAIRQHRSLRLIGIGLLQLFWGYIFLLVGAFTAAFGIFILEDGPIVIKSEVGIVLGLIGLAIGAISVMVLMIGHLFCLAIPGERKARGWIVLSAIFQLVGLLSVACMIESPPLLSFCGLLFVAGMVALLLYIMEVAQFIDHDQLRRKSKRVLLAVVLLFMCLFFVSGLAFGDLVSDLIEKILAAGLGIAGLVVFVVFVAVVGKLRMSVTLAIRDAETRVE